jgi:hypothetical protein
MQVTEGISCALRRENKIVLAKRSVQDGQGRTSVRATANARTLGQASPHHSCCFVAACCHTASPEICHSKVRESHEIGQPGDRSKPEPRTVRARVLTRRSPCTGWLFHGHNRICVRVRRIQHQPQWMSALWSQTLRGANVVNKREGWLK